MISTNSALCRTLVAAGTATIMAVFGLSTVATGTASAAPASTTMSAASVDSVVLMRDPTNPTVCRAPIVTGLMTQAMRQTQTSGYKLRIRQVVGEQLCVTGDGHKIPSAFTRVSLRWVDVKTGRTERPSCGDAIWNDFKKVAFKMTYHVDEDGSFVFVHTKRFGVACPADGTAKKTVWLDPPPLRKSMVYRSKQTVVIGANLNDPEKRITLRLPPLVS